LVPGGEFSEIRRRREQKNQADRPLALVYPLYVALRGVLTSETRREAGRKLADGVLAEMEEVLHGITAYL
jgi:hypothetical protein